MPSESDQPFIFLSHAGEDAQSARELARHLTQAGLVVWLDVERLRPGDRWMETIERGLNQATAFVIYVGRSGVLKWVDQEVRVALDRNTKDPSFPVIPVLGTGSDPEALPSFLKQYQWLDLRQGNVFKRKQVNHHSPERRTHKARLLLELSRWLRLRLPW